MLRNLVNLRQLTIVPPHLNLLRRAKCSCALVPSLNSSNERMTVICSQPQRPYSYYHSKIEESPEKYTAYEKSYDEWKFVEKLIPNTHVPAPPTDPNVELPSGWKPPNPPKSLPYLIRRTKNHQVPVYLHIKDRGQVRHTIIRRVEGNIWQLEKDIGEFLQKEIPNKTIITRTHEICRQVIIKGDLIDHVKQWTIDRGF